jgi:Ner family transcriptional regulator
MLEHKTSLPALHPEDIKAGLRKRGSSLSKIARDLGLNRSTVSCVLYGRHSRRVRIAIAQQLGMKPEQLWPNL